MMQNGIIILILMAIFLLLLQNLGYYGENDNTWKTRKKVLPYHWPDASKSQRETASQPVQYPYRSPRLTKSDKPGLISAVNQPVIQLPGDAGPVTLQVSPGC